ncbi:MAG: hypothetical protein ACI9SP_002789 [Arenicella sp.]
MNQSNINNLQNSNLRIFAVLEAQMARGVERPTEYLIPFFIEYAQQNIGKPFDLKNALEVIEEKYSLEIPVYLADELTMNLLESGVVEKNSAIDTYICVESDMSENDISLTQGDLDSVEVNLSAFAASYGVELPAKSPDWIKVLFDFFAGKEVEKNAASVKGLIINDAKATDYWVVANFITQAKQKSDELYGIIQRIYAAYSIADTISKIQNVGHEKDWNGLYVIYDSTVLMRLLGTSGEMLKNATLQMHNMLLEMGCRTHYFNHNLGEVIQNITAIKGYFSNGRAVHRETLRALENAEITPAQITLLAAQPDIKLGELSISELQMPRRLENTTGQINTAEAQHYLESRIHYNHNSQAAQIDADSLDHILHLRKGKSSLDIPNSKFVFVTHNSKLAKVTLDYCTKKCGYKKYNAPPIVTINTLTKLAWLATSKDESIDQITNDLVINCFQASLPDSRWVEKFWDVVQETNPELLDQNAAESLYLLDVRQIAESVTLGNSSLLDSGIDIPEIISRAKAHAENQKMLYDGKLATAEENSNRALDDERAKSLSRELKLHFDNKALEDQALEQQAAVLSKEKEKAVSDTFEGIGERIERLAKIKSGFWSKVITGIIVLALVFISEGWMGGNMEFVKEISTWVTRGIAIVSFASMFFPALSFLLVRPTIENALTKYFTKHYSQILHN